ncbi:MAG: hypothetical protein FWD87_04945 [Spirochaetaceae bacterium]|nr:hypothetical protein [Spirochaetaceae bacterium]
MKDWTTRGEMTAVDLEVIGAAVKKDPSIGRIMITGEVHTTTIDKQRLYIFDELNDLAGEPLFITTKNRTIRMVRFDPEKVWSSIEPNLFASLVKEEEKRLGVAVGSVVLDEFDFYYSMIKAIKQRIIRTDPSKPPASCPMVGRRKTIEDFYEFMYISSLLLFNKPGYMAVPISEHFAMPEAVEYMKTVKFRHLTQYEADQHKHIHDNHKNKKGITNDELDFLSGLFSSHTK